MELEEEEERETPTEKRLRLAQEYLQVLEDQNESLKPEKSSNQISKTLKEDYLDSTGEYFFPLSKAFKSDLPFEELNIDLSYKPLTSIAIYQNLVYCGSKDCNIYAYNTELKEISVFKGLISSKAFRDVSNFPGHRSEIIAIDISPCGRYLASAELKAKQIFIWSTKTKTILFKLRGHRDAVTGLAFQTSTPSSSQPNETEELLLFSCSRDRSVQVWDISARAKVDELFGHHSEILSIACLNKTRVLTSGSTIRLWKVPEQSQLLYPVVNKVHVDCVVFFGSTYFVSGSEDGKLWLWDTHKKKAITSINAHGSKWVTALATLDRTDTIVSAAKGEVSFWKIDVILKSFYFLKAIPIIGFINSIAAKFDQKTNQATLFMAVGSEPRLGRWETTETRRGSIVLLAIQHIEISDEVSKAESGSSVSNTSDFGSSSEEGNH